MLTAGEFAFPGHETAARGEHDLVLAGRRVGGRGDGLQQFEGQPVRVGGGVAETLQGQPGHQARVFVGQGAGEAPGGGVLRLGRTFGSGQRAAGPGHQPQGRPAAVGKVLAGRGEDAEHGRTAHGLVEHRLRVGGRLAEDEYHGRVTVLGERRRPARRVDGSGQHRHGARTAAGQRCREVLGQRSLGSALGGHDPPRAVLGPGHHGV